MFFHKNFTAAYVKFAENESFVNGELRFEQIGATGYINVNGAILGLFNGQFGHGYRVNYFNKNSIYHIQICRRKNLVFRFMNLVILLIIVWPLEVTIIQKMKIKPIKEISLEIWMAMEPQNYPLK